MNFDKKLIKIFPPKVVLFSEGDLSQDIYLIIEGKVEVKKNGEVIAEIHDCGTFVGELSAILNVPRSATVTTISTTKAVVISPDNFESVIRTNPSIAIKLIKSLASRLYQTSKKYTALMKLGKGKIYNNNESAEITAELLEKFLKLNPNDFEATIVMAYYNYTLGEIAKTKALLSKATEIVENIEI